MASGGDGELELTEMFLRKRMAAGVAGSSVRAYRGWLRGFVAWRELRGTTLSDVTPSLIAEWRDDRLRSQRRSPATVEAQQRVVIAFMRFLTQVGVNPEFPPHIRVKTPRKPARQPKLVSDWDADRLLWAAEEKGPREAVLVSLLMLAGLRIGEALQMRKDDIQINWNAASWVDHEGGTRQGDARAPGAPAAPRPG